MRSNTNWDPILTCGKASRGCGDGESGDTQAIDGSPIDLDCLRTESFPEIHALYQRLAKGDSLDPKQVVEQGYDRVAEQHLEWAQSVRREERARYTAVLHDALAPGADVLELGCGAGVPS